MPGLPVVFTRRAARQVEDVARWWAANHLARLGYDLYYRLAPRLRQVQVIAFWRAHRGVPPPL